MQVNRQALLLSLEQVSPGLSTVRETVEQSSCFVFHEGEVVTFNDEIACTAKTPLDGVEGAVPAAPLMALLGKLAEEDVNITIDDGEFRIAGAGRRGGLRMAEEVLLPIQKVERPKNWQPLDEAFCEAVTIVQQCAGNDVDKFLLTCVHLNPEFVEACDNYQMARYPVAVAIRRPTLVKRDAIKHITGLDMAEIAETKNWVHFRNPAGLVLSCRRYMEDFPDLSGTLKKHGGTQITLPGGMAEAIDKADVLSSENSENNQIMVKLSPGRMAIRGSGTLGWWEERKKVGYAGPAMSFMISPKLMTEICKRHNECEISDDANLLRVNGGKFTYVSCLGAADE